MVSATVRSKYLLILSDRVAEGDKARLELVRRQAAGPGLVEVVERSSELVELLLGDALRVPGQDLVLHLVDGPVDRGDQLLPTDSESLHGVLAVAVLEHEGLLDLLVDPLQLLQVRLELVDGLLVLAEARQLVFK